MGKLKIEFYVGIFTIIGLFCVGYLLLSLGEVGFIKSKRYPVHAFFTSVSGLRSGARVEMTGVEIGMVSNISIDKEQLLARVELSIDQGVELAEDIIASVKTAGIIGEKYIAILPGGSDVLLKAGDEIYNTESSLDLESLVRKFIFKKEN